MAKRTAAQVAAKWARNASAGVTDYKSGIQATTVNPMQLAAAAATTWLANTTAAKAKFQRNVGLVSKTTWMNQATTKGATNFTTGIQAGTTKYTAAIGPLLAFITNARQNLPARGNPAQNEARMVAFVRAMRGYQKPAGS